MKSSFINCQLAWKYLSTSQADLDLRLVQTQTLFWINELFKLNLFDSNLQPKMQNIV